MPDVLQFAANACIAMKPTLSVIIITKNEEQRLPRCLESVTFADEIIVLDGGSTDRTVEIEPWPSPPEIGYSRSMRTRK